MEMRVQDPVDLFNPERLEPAQDLARTEVDQYCVMILDDCIDVTSVLVGIDSGRHLMQIGIVCRVGGYGGCRGNLGRSVRAPGRRGERDIVDGNSECE